MLRFTSHRVVVMAVLIVCLGLADTILAQPTVTRGDRLWIVDSQGKLVGTTAGNIGASANTSVWLKVDNRLIQVPLIPTGFDVDGGLYYESPDCQGPPLLYDWEALSFSTSYAVSLPGKTLYLPDETVPAQTVHLQSFTSSHGCILDDRIASVRRPVAVVDLHTVFTPPFRLTLAPTDVQHIVDVPAPGTIVGPSFVVSGWAIDPQATNGTGIDTLHIWAYRRDVNSPPQFLGVPQVVLRPDVAAIYGPQFGPSGYSLTTPALAPGLYDIVVFHHRTSTGTFEGARVVRVTVQ